MHHLRYTRANKYPYEYMMGNPMLRYYIGHSKIMTEYLDGIYHCLLERVFFTFLKV